MRARRSVFLSVLIAGFGIAADSVRGQVPARLDPVPGPRQKPYSPADGERVAVTPPPFIWVPYGKNATYSLQVSRARSFSRSAETRTFDDLKTSVFVPREPLAAGEWFWRYGVKTAKRYVYGKPRPFTVPGDTRAFPFPDFAEVVRRVPRERPRLFFPGGRLATVRAASQGPLRSQVKALVRRAERAVGQEIVPEPGRPRTGPERVTVMRTTRPPMDDMERCALAYLLTERRALGLEAKRRLLHFFSWDPRGPTGLWGYDEPAMWMMMRGIRAYDWTHELFTPAERAKIEPVMKERARQFYVHLKDRRRFESDPYESHAGRMPGFLGEAALCFAHEWPEAREWLEYATLLYYTSYPAWGGDDGGWQEGPGYWSAYMSFALHYVVALRRAGGVDLMRKPFFRNTAYYALYMATPYHEQCHFGDGLTGSPARLGPVVYAFSSLLQDPHLRWFQAVSSRRIGGDLLTLSTYDPDLAPKSPRPLPPSRVFPSVGLAAFHTALGDKENDVSLLFRSSPYGGVSHGHANQNAFVIEAFGRGLAIATGYYPWYGSPHHHRWTRATKASNSILVDGEGQVPRDWRAGGEITSFHSDPPGPRGYDYVEGDAARAYKGRLTRFRRHVVHVRPGVFVMLDDLAAPREATFSWLLHAHQRIQVAGPRLRVVREPAAMDVHLLVPDSLSIVQTDRYDPEPEQHEHRPSRYAKTWHLTASTARPAREGRFLTVFAVGRSSDKSLSPKIELLQGEGALGVRLTRPDGSEDVLGFRTENTSRTVGCGGLKSDGRIFAEGRDREDRLVRRLRM